ADEPTDYPCVDLNVPAFTSEFAAKVDSLLGGAGELLPLAGDDGRCVAFNPTTLLTIDAVVADKSHIDFRRGRLPGQQTLIAEAVHRLEFLEHAISDHPIFRFRPLPHDVIVTDRFLDACRKAGATGIFVQMHGSTGPAARVM